MVSNKSSGMTKFWTLNLAILLVIQFIILSNEFNSVSGFEFQAIRGPDKIRVNKPKCFGDKVLCNREMRPVVTTPKPNRTEVPALSEPEEAEGWPLWLIILVAILGILVIVGIVALFMYANKSDAAPPKSRYSSMRSIQPSTTRRGSISRAYPGTALSSRPTNRSTLTKVSTVHQLSRRPSSSRSLVSKRASSRPSARSSSKLSRSRSSSSGKGRSSGTTATSATKKQ